MIVLSNLRLEERGDWACLVCDCKASFAREKELWYAVPKKYKFILAENVYDAFLVTMLYPAMYYKEDIVIEGYLTEKLYRNIMLYVQALLKDFSGELSSVEIKIKGFDVVEKSTRWVGTGFSGGVDSFSTFYDHYERETNEEYKINVLFFANTGSHGDFYNEATYKRFLARYELLKAFPEEKHIPYILVDSNVFAFHKESWHLKNGTLRRISAILACQKGMSKYYVSSPCSYQEMMFYGRQMYNRSLEEYSDPYLLPLLSPEGLDIIPDGFQYTRSGKTEIIAQYAAAQEYLNVCVNSSDSYVSAKNCSRCDKCLRTLMTLESMDALEQFSRTFDLNVYRKNALGYKSRQGLLYNKDLFAKDNVDFARLNHKSVPPYWIATMVYLPGLLLRAGYKCSVALLGKERTNKIKRIIKK